MPFLVLAGVLWGTGGLFGRLLADSTGLSALAVAGYRLAVGGLLIIGYLAVTGRRVPTGPAALRRIAATGILAAVFQACYFTAVALTSVSLATLVTIGSAPVIVLLVQRATGVRTIGTAALAVLGLGLLVGVPADGSAVGSPVAGAAFAVAAGAGFAAMTLLAARPVPGLDAAATTGPAFVLGGAGLLCAAALTTGVTFAPSLPDVGLLGAFGVVPTALAYTFYFRGLAVTSPALGALMALLEPLTAAVLAALLLHDRLGPTGIAGAVLIGVAVALAPSALVSANRGQDNDSHARARSA